MGKVHTLDVELYDTPGDKAKIELLLIGLNRKYPQDTEWEFSVRSDGDLKFSAGRTVHILNQAAFRKPSVLDVWDHIEKYWNLDREDWNG